MPLTAGSVRFSAPLLISIEMLRCQSGEDSLLESSKSTSACWCRGGNARAIAHLFPNSFRGFNPSLALRETHMRELRRFDNARAVFFKHTPVVHERQFPKPFISHAGNHLQSRLIINRVNTLKDAKVNSFKRGGITRKLKLAGRVAPGRARKRKADPSLCSG